MGKHRSCIGTVAWVAACQVAVALGADVCDNTAEQVLSACRRQAIAAYHLALANCENPSSEEERAACRAQAKLDLAEAKAECRDQFSSRSDLCDALGDGPYDPVIDPNRFTSVVDHPLMPLVPGTTLVYEGATSEGVEHDEFEVTHRTRVIMGVTCVEVHDVVQFNGQLIEDTLDWFAQDFDGNVWYFGENSEELDDGLVVSLRGSWIGGVNSAKPGIIMQAAPAVGMIYRQEFSLANAEDVAEVLETNASVSVPYGKFENCLRTREFTPQEPDVFEDKYYAPGIGAVLTVDVSTGDRFELIDVRHE